MAIILRKVTKHIISTEKQPLHPKVTRRHLHKPCLQATPKTDIFYEHYKLHQLSKLLSAQKYTDTNTSYFMI